MAICLLGYVIFILVATYYFNMSNNRFDPAGELPFVSVVVAARNEAENIHSLLESLHCQNYPDKLWEVILVDDHSEDDTVELINHYIEKYGLSHIKQVASGGIGKKSAIETGVGIAQGEWILQTDADCVAGPFWIKTMAAHMKDEFKFVSGPIRLVPGDSWFERLQALEMLGLVTLGAGSMMAGFPNMANGANMAYHRLTFLELGGFGSSKEIASGDDEFLVQAIDQAFPGGLTFAKDPEAMINTATIPTWSGFRSQRIRWVSKAKSYLKRSTNLIQIMAWLGFLAFPWWIGLGMINPGCWLVAIGLFLLKLLADHWLMRSGALFLQKTDWLRWLLLLEILYIPYVIWIGIRGNLSSSFVWKDRKTT